MNIMKPLMPYQMSSIIQRCVHSSQQSRGGKKLFFNFYQILLKSKTTYPMKAGYEISVKYDALNHQKKQFKVPENTACLTESGIYEVKKGVKES